MKQFLKTFVNIRSLLKKMGKNIVKCTNKSVSSKCSLGMLATLQKLFDHVMQSARDAHKEQFKKPQKQLVI